MDNVKNYVLLGSVVLAVVFGVMAFKTPSVVTVPSEELGAAGQTFSFRAFLGNGATMGGNIATTSTAATYTTSARDFNNTPTVISWLPNVNTTVSLDRKSV